jgi:hypothetical protein
MDNMKKNQKEEFVQKKLIKKWYEKFEKKKEK